MKKKMIAAAALILILSGCSLTDGADGELSVSGSGETESQISSQSGNPEVEPGQSEAGETDNSVPMENWKDYESYIYTLWRDNQLERSWNGSPPAPDPNNNQMHAYDILSVTKEGDIAEIIVQTRAEVYIDPETMQESIDYGTVAIQSGNAEDNRIPISKSVVRIEEKGEGFRYLSCDYLRYKSPGLDFLKAKTKELEPKLAASEKIDPSKYDKYLVGYIKKLVLSNRYIESADEITLYDLENLTGRLEIAQYAFGWDLVLPEDYRVESSLLRLIPNMTTVELMLPLTDYGVFENMSKIETLSIYNARQGTFDTLKTGRVGELVLYDAEAEVCDISGVDTEVLKMHSWSVGVNGFKGCEKLKRLHIVDTKTDTRLFNTDNFPNVKYMGLYYFHDYPKSHDFSNLKTFTDTKIDISLDYYGCMNDTIISLYGVKINNIYINDNYGGTRTDFDRSLVEKLSAENIVYDSVYGQLWDDPGNW